MKQSDKFITTSRQALHLLNEWRNFYDDFY